MGNDGLHRRKFLSSVGVAGGIAIGGVGQVTAKKREVENLDDLLQSEKVSSILDELPNLNLQTQRAERIDLSSDGDSFFRTTVIPANFGTLSIGGPAGTEYKEVQFEFKDHHGRYAARLKRKARKQDAVSPAHDWPKGTDAFLLGTETDAVFFRTTSEAEHQQLAELCDRESEEIHSYSHGGLEGYQVIDSGPDGKTADVIDIDADLTEIESIETVDRSRESGGPVQTADSDCSTGLVLTNAPLCVLEIDMCFSCAGLCYAGSFGTGLPGVAACLICLTHSCGLSALPEVGACNTLAACADLIPDWELPDA